MKRQSELIHHLLPMSDCTEQIVFLQVLLLHYNGVWTSYLVFYCMLLNVFVWCAELCRFSYREITLILTEIKKV